MTSLDQLLIVRAADELKVANLPTYAGDVTALRRAMERDTEEIPLCGGRRHGDIQCERAVDHDGDCAALVLFPHPAELTQTIARIDLTDGEVTIAIPGEHTRYLDLCTSTGHSDDAAIHAHADEVITRVTAYRRIGDWTPAADTDLQLTAPFAPHPDRCVTCVTGCECETGSPGCAHAGCWGTDNDAIRNSCPGVSAMTPAELAAAR